jgi:hypothetical protein
VRVPFLLDVEPRGRSSRFFLGSSCLPRVLSFDFQAVLLQIVILIKLLLAQAHVLLIFPTLPNCSFPLQEEIRGVAGAPFLGQHARRTGGASRIVELKAPEALGGAIV